MSISGKLLPFSEVTAIEAALTTSRFGTFLTATGGRNRARALALYEWNATISAAFIVPLHLCEVVIRNAVAEAIEKVYGPAWPWSAGFEQSLPAPTVGYSPRRDLQKARQGQLTAGKVIPELKFAFWNEMLTRRHDGRLWVPYFKTSFPFSPSAPIPKLRGILYQQLAKVRKFRNRIAHHEPILSVHHGNEYARVARLVAWRCQRTRAWLSDIEDVTALVSKRP